MKVFKSKIGNELLVPITLLFSAILVLVILDGAPLDAIITVGSILLITYTFTLHTFLGTNYSITDENYLLIKSGFIKYKPVNIHTIITITKTQSIMASPAPSMDRIEIFYNKYDSVIISPKDKLGLIRALQSINPNISYYPKRI